MHCSPMSTVHYRYYFLPLADTAVLSTFVFCLLACHPHAYTAVLVVICWVCVPSSVLGFPHLNLQISPIPSIYSVELSRIIKSMLRRCPVKRATAAEILSTPLMQVPVHPKTQTLNPKHLFRNPDCMQPIIWPMLVTHIILH